MLISLAAGVHPEWAERPADFVTAAAQAGWPACGIWYDPNTWTDQTTKQVKQVLDNTGLVALDLEIFFLDWDMDLAGKMIDTAAELGVRNILSVTRQQDQRAIADSFSTFCARAEGTDLRVCIEFMRIMGLSSLEQALHLLDTVDNPRAGILVDNLHLARCGQSPDVLANVDPHRLPYAQWCDATAEPADSTTKGLRIDAMDLRRNVGQGDLPCSQFVQALPAETPLSVEVRSKYLRDTYPDAVERARVVLEATRAGVLAAN